MLMLAQLPFWRENTASEHEMMKNKKQCRGCRGVNQRWVWWSINKASEKIRGRITKNITSNAVDPGPGSKRLDFEGMWLSGII